MSWDIETIVQVVMFFVAFGVMCLAFLGDPL